MLSKRKLWSVVAALAVILIGLFFPLPVRDVDKEDVIARTAQYLREQRPVCLDGKYMPFYDSDRFAESDRTWYYYNATPLQTTKLEQMEIQPFPKDQERNLYDWYSKRNVLIEVTYQDPMKSYGEPHLRFNCFFGWLGGEYYRVHVYRCLLGTFASYTWEGAA
jgi:hypothetical protein